jgi:hypothetical protein
MVHSNEPLTDMLLRFAYSSGMCFSARLTGGASKVQAAH